MLTLAAASSPLLFATHPESSNVSSTFLGAAASQQALFFLDHTHAVTDSSVRYQQLQTVHLSGLKRTVCNEMAEVAGQNKITELLNLEKGGGTAAVRESTETKMT